MILIISYRYPCSWIYLQSPSKSSTLDLFQPYSFDILLAVSVGYVFWDSLGLVVWGKISPYWQFLSLFVEFEKSQADYYPGCLAPTLYSYAIQLFSAFHSLSSIFHYSPSWFDKPFIFHAWHVWQTSQLYNGLKFALCILYSWH